MKKLLFVIFYNLAAVAVILLVLELVLFLFFPYIKPLGTDRNLIADSVYFDSPGLRPNSFGNSNGAVMEVDQYGFRKTHRKIDLSKKSILLIGNSVTLGLGVDNDSTFAAFTQAKTSEINVLNLSVIGFNLADFNNVFRYYLSRNLFDSLNVSAVVICWCLSDVYFGSVNNIEMPGGTMRYIFSDFLTFIRSHSRTYIFAKNIIFDRPANYFDFYKQFYYEDNGLFKSSVDTLQSISKMASDRNIHLYILQLPYEYQLRYPTRAGIFQPQEILASKLKSRRLTVIDPAEFLEGTKIPAGNLYLYGDGIHFSETGHKYIANFLADCLKTEMTSK